MVYHKAATNRVGYRFVPIPYELVNDDRMTPRDKWVYVVLRSYADRSHKAWPKLDTLSSIVGVSQPTVSKALNTLEDLGYIKRTRAEGKHSSMYYVYDGPKETQKNLMDESDDSKESSDNTKESSGETQKNLMENSKESYDELYIRTRLNELDTRTNNASEKIETTQQTPGNNEHAWEDLDDGTEDGWEPYDPQNPPLDALEAQTPTISQPQPENPSTPPRNASRGRYGFDPEDDRWERDMKFQQLISVYPRKQGVKEAYPAWRRAIRKTNATIIIGAAANYASTVEDPRYAPMLGKWLDGERWLDQPLAAPKPKETQTYQSKDDQIAYWRERLDWMTERLKEQDAYESRDYAIECLEPPAWVIPYLR